MAVEQEEGEREEKAEEEEQEKEAEAAEEGGRGIRRKKRKRRISRWGPVSVALPTAVDWLKFLAKPFQHFQSIRRCRLV